MTTENMKPKIKKALSIGTFIVVIVFAIFLFFKFYFVFGDGIKSGDLNYFVHNGYIFKTYEGKIIETNSRSLTAVPVPPVEFSFSVENKVVADSLMRCNGKIVEVHYKEYLGILPWRGVNKIVVDRIVSVK
jgi:hypothetical protein